MLPAPPVELDRSDSPPRIRAYRGQAVWSSYDRAADRFTLERTNGTPVLRSRAFADPDIGRGPDEKPLVVFARKGRIEGDGRVLVRTAGTPSSPTIWRSTLAWVGEDQRVYTAEIGGKPRRVDLPGRTREVELFGRTLAAITDGKVVLQRLDGSLRRVVRKPRPGPDWIFRGLAFDRTRLYFAATCQGTCETASRAYRYAAGHTAAAKLPTNAVTGFSFSAGAGYWGRSVEQPTGETYSIVETAPLTFR